MDPYLSSSSPPDEAKHSPDHRLDVSGLRCPVPLLMTARCLGGLDVGKRLLVVGDDPEMLVDLPAWCRESGNRMLDLRRVGSEIRCLIQKRQPNP